MSKQNQGSVLDSEEGIRFRGKTVRALISFCSLENQLTLPQDSRMSGIVAQSSWRTGATARRSYHRGTRQHLTYAESVQVSFGYY